MIQTQWTEPFQTSECKNAAYQRRCLVHRESVTVQDDALPRRAVWLFDTSDLLCIMNAGVEEAVLIELCVGAQPQFGMFPESRP